ncbi:MAG: hypothetical protein ACRC2V_07035, partial [Xenococcaceae cyanobacterium]
MPSNLLKSSNRKLLGKDLIEEQNSEVIAVEQTDRDLATEQSQLLLVNNVGTSLDETPEQIAKRLASVLEKHRGERQLIVIQDF